MIPELFVKVVSKLLKHEEGQLVSKIPSFLDKPEMPSKLFHDYITTGESFLKDQAKTNLEKLRSQADVFFNPEAISIEPKHLPETDNTFSKRLTEGYEAKQFKDAMTTEASKLQPRGYAEVKSILGTAGTLAAGLRAYKLATTPSVVTYENAESTPSVLKTQKESPRDKTDVFLEAVAHNETRSVDNPYSYHKFSGNKHLGEDLGKYQVTEGELKAYAQRFLGFTPTTQEFLSSPEMQDIYMKNKYHYYLKQGYTPQQIADIHRKGFTNSSDPGSNKYQSPEYVKSFNSVFND